MTIPFESYAKLIRTLAPLVRKVLFYDGEAIPAWISDGVEEPELRNSVALLMAERSRLEDDVAAFPIGAGDARETFYLFVARGQHGTLTGLLGVVCRSALAPSEPGRSDLTQRLLAPVVDVYRHCANHSPPVSTATPRIAVSKCPIPVTPPARNAADFYDEVLRQTAAQIECSFAAIVMPACGVSRYCRTSENESDVSIHSAVQSVHAALFKWMAFRRQPTAINRTGGVHGATARYKIAAAPILDHAGQVLGLMLIFREPSAADFLTSDLECARAACWSLSPNVSHHETRTPAQIRRALTDGHFRLYAQRISPLRKHARPARFEVLLRMQNADAIYTPETFLEVARTDHLMPEIDRWVVRHSLHALSSRAELLGDHNVEFCINVDEQSLITPGFADFIVAELAGCAVPADLLVFEIAEPTALEKPAEVESFADRVSAAGCRLSLDHFGAGTGSLATLSRLHISSVKIDGPLVRDVATDRRSECLIRDVASMTASMAIETVAGRVEQDAVREKLRTLGIDYAQGFALSPPRPVDEALAELEYLQRAGRRRTVVEPMLATA
jgi:EAL domain-containing protein (putative c-di-GMP-specific phosphodiesterase class I)